MSSIFNTLNIGYSGLNASQLAVDATSHNIANAEVEGYTRQRVVQTAATPVSKDIGQLGNGVKIDDIGRIFDSFVYTRYTNISSDKSYSDYETSKLQTLSSYFPEIDGVGIKSDLANYYDKWQTFADNPDNDSVKVTLATQAKTLSSHIQSTRDNIYHLQKQINDDIAVNVREVNEIAQKIAELNVSIDQAEAGDNYSANDLRDQRNLLEKNLGDLIGAEVNYGQLDANTQLDTNANIRTGSYTISVNGFNIVDGNSYHPLTLTNDNENGFYEISYKRQDGVLIPMEEDLNGGKIGAMLDLRGGSLDKQTGQPVDGIIQKSLVQLDAFSKGLIESTNNLYASTSTTKMTSNYLDIKPDSALMDGSENIKEGAFDLIIYDSDGEEVARRTIKIDNTTTMTGDAGSNSIQGQMEANKDDNDDNDGTNDIDDFLNFNWATYPDGKSALEFSMDPTAKSNGYTFAIEDVLSDGGFDSGTNFAGALGMNRFFDGDDASSISLNNRFDKDPTILSAGSTSSSGENDVALNMVQHQFEEYNFKVGDVEYNTTTYGMFDVISTDVGIATNSAITKQETVNTQFNAVELEYASVSKVSVDEEMTNLIRYQNSYAASAKIITTVDQMMQTLLGLKR